MTMPYASGSIAFTLTGSAGSDSQGLLASSNILEWLYLEVETEPFASFMKGYMRRWELVFSFNKTEIHPPSNA